MRMRLAMLWAGVVLCGTVAASEPPTESKSQTETKVGSNTITRCYNEYNLYSCHWCDQSGCHDVVVPSPIDGKDCKKVNSEVANSSLGYRHRVWDYRGTAPQTGCATCGNSSTLPTEELPFFGIERIHQYRMSYMWSSFGEGVFCSYDMKVELNRTNTNGSGNIILMDPHQAQRFWYGERVGYQGDTSDDGRYWCYSWSVTQEARLLDSGMSLTVNQAAASYVTVRGEDGRKMTFEIIRTNTSTSTTQLMGRLIKMADANGNATTITYQYAASASDTTLGGNRKRLWMIDQVTDAYGRVGTFHYESSTIGGRWLVASIDCPNGTTVYYDYTDAYLSSVTYPDSTTTTITQSVNSTAQCLEIDFNDAAGHAQERNKSVLLTLDSWVDPNDANNVVDVAYNRVRAVFNGEDEVIYYNQEDPNNNLLLYYYYGAGRFESYEQDVNGGPVAFRVATDPDFNNDPATFTWQTVKSYAVDNDQLMISQETDTLGRTTAYTNDISNGTVTQITYPDTTTETTTFNAFQKPLHHVDRIGRVTDCTYDSNGNRLTKTVAVGTAEQAVWSWTYNARGQVATATDANSNVTTYAYTTEGYLTSITEPPDNTGDPQGVTNYTYDSAGLLTGMTDQLSRPTSYAYDARNRIGIVTYSDSTTESFIYGTGVNANLLVERTDRSDSADTIDYDLAGRETDYTTAAGSAVEVHRTCTYLAGKRLKAACTDKGNTTSYAYNYCFQPLGVTRQPNTATSLTAATVYDEQRRTDQSIDDYGRKCYYVYDVNDRVTRRVCETAPGTITLPTPPTDPDYLTDRDTYLNGLTRVLTANAAYLITDMSYDAEGQKLTDTDGRGDVATYAYDNQGRNTQTIEAFGTAIAATTQFQYDSQGNRTLLIKPREFAEASAFRTAYTYTGRNLLKTKTEASTKTEAATESYTYYLDRRSKDRIDGRGNTWTTYWSNCCGYHKVNAQPAADVDDNTGTAATRAAYVGNRDSRNLVTHEYTVPDWSIYPQDPSQADPDYHSPTVPLNTTTTRYDARMRPIAQTRWLIELGFTVSKNDPPIAGDHGTNASDGLTTRWVYDDDLTDTTGLDATYSAFLTGLNLGSGSVGSAVEVTNAASEKTVTVYDGMGRTVRTVRVNSTTATSVVQSTVYDNVVAGGTGTPGDLLETRSIAHPNGIADSKQLINKARTDGAGRTLRTIDAESKVMQYGFDAASNRVSIRDPNSVGEDCVFDARNRRTQCTDTHGDVTHTAYDADNNVITMTDALSHDTTCVYDARERKTSCTDRVSGVTSYTYDENNNLLTLTDGDSGTTTYVYDARNLTSSETLPPSTGGTRTFAYDAASRQTRRTDQTPQATTYVYDRANRMTGRNYPDSSNDNFTYDGVDRILTATSSRYSNVVTRSYTDGGETAGRLTSETQTVGGNNFVVAYGYDSADRKISIIYPDGKVVAQSFTDRDQLSEIDYDSVAVATRTYDDGMRLSATAYHNGLVENCTYRSDDNRLLTKAVSGVTSFSYTYDANKNPLTQGNGVDTQDNQTYTYDNEDRLATYARASGKTQSWTLSKVGDWQYFNDNGSAQTRTHDAVHELTQINGQGLTYDAKGNLTADNAGATYAWDIENRLSGANSNASYAYDVFNRRVKKTVGTNATVYAYDGWRAIAEYENGATAGSPARSFVFGAYLDEVLMMNRSAGRLYYHSDYLYNVHALTNAAGAIVEAYEYDPYGRQSVDTSAGTDTTWFTGDDAWTVGGNSAVGNPYMNKGQRFDPESGLECDKERYLNTALGRYMSRDPIGFESQDTNLYEFVFDNPLRFDDPNGLARFDVTVVVSSKGKGKGKLRGGADPAIRKAKLSHPLAYKPDSWDDLIKQLKEKVGAYDPTGENGNCIEFIQFIGHSGAEGFARLAPDFNLSEASSLQGPTGQGNRDRLAELKALLCTGSTVRFRQCDVAYGPIGQAFIIEVAKDLGADVEAPTDSVSPGWDFFPPEWKSASPSGEITKFKYWK
jgi:RHS repeat-associated protein